MDSGTEKGRAKRLTNHTASIIKSTAGTTFMLGKVRMGRRGLRTDCERSYLPKDDGSAQNDMITSNRVIQMGLSHSTSAKVR
jgi:hypothetical protein